MRVLLVNPPTLHRWRRVTDSMAEQVKTPYMGGLLAHDANLMNGQSSLPGEHLGLQSLAAAIRVAGHEAHILDAAREWHGSLRQTADLFGNGDGYDLVGFSGPTDVIGENRWLMRALRKAGYCGPVVLGNDHASLNAERELEATEDLDFILRGEAEGSIVELVSALAADSPLDGVRGLSWRAHGGIRHTAPGSSLVLNDLEPPVRDGTAEVVRRGLSASMFTKRGCLYRCAHCTTGQVSALRDVNRGSSWRSKSPQVAVTEFLTLVEQFGLEHVTIVDDLFVAKDATSQAWAFEFSELLLEADNSANFMIDCRIDSVTPALVNTLKRAGLNRVFIGLESGSKSSLRGLNKQYGSGVDAGRQLAMIAEAGIDIILGFIFVTPGETPQSMAESAAFLEAAGMHDYQLLSQRARIYPGTTLESQVRATESLTGEYPFFGFDLSGSSGAVAQSVSQAYQRVHAMVDGHILSRGQQRQLFTDFTKAVTEICASAEVSAGRSAVVEAAIERLVSDARKTLADAHA